MVGNLIKALFLFTKNLMQQASFFHHAEVNGILRENILQHKIASGTATIFYFFNHLVEGNGRCCIQHKVEFDIAPEFAYCFIELIFK